MLAGACRYAVTDPGDLTMGAEARCGPLRVLHVLSNPTVGGIVRMLSVLVTRADPGRADMRVVNLEDQAEPYAVWTRAGVRAIRLPRPGRLLLGSILDLVRLFRRERPDVVEIYGLRANIIGRLAAAIAGVPVVLTGVISTDDWRRWYHVWLDRLTRWAVTRWVCNAEACKRSLIQRERHPPDRIDVIYDAIETDQWVPARDPQARTTLLGKWGWPQDSLVCATVANLRRDKGIHHLIDAVPAVLAVQPRARFLLVGADEMGGALQRRCVELGLERVVAFAGFQDEIRPIYDACDVAVLPSLREGLPICLIEAMSMELPVVATTVGGIPELVEHERTGLLVAPHDVQGLAAALIRVLRSPDLRADMGRAGRARVLATFKIERMVEELQAYYERQVSIATGRARLTGATNAQR